MRYQWVKGTRFAGEAQPVGERIATLAAQAGGVTPASVLADARANHSPLHDYFEWSDARAGEAYRLIQARALLRGIVTVEVDGVALAEPTRAFICVTVGGDDEEDPGGRAYATVTRVVKTPDMREEVIERAKKELEEWASRYARFAELRHVAQEIVALVKTLPT